MQKTLSRTLSILFVVFLSLAFLPKAALADTCRAGKICPFGYEPHNLKECYDPSGECGDCFKIENEQARFAFEVFCDSPAATQNPDTLYCPSGFSRNDCPYEAQRNAGICCKNGGHTPDDVAHGVLSPPFSAFDPCQSVPDSARQACIDCAGAGPGAKEKVWTALGCIEVNKEGMVTQFVRIGLGLAGGITLLVILASAFQLTISQGDPKKTEEVRQSLTAGISGLLFIIFSMVILRVIGIDILRIPGF